MMSWVTVSCRDVPQGVSFEVANWYLLMRARSSSLISFHLPLQRRLTSRPVGLRMVNTFCQSYPWKLTVTSAVFISLIHPCGEWGTIPTNI